MSTIGASSFAARRPTAMTAAIIALVLLALAVLVPVPGLGDVPASALLVGYAFAALKVVAAVGLWWSRKWAAILGFVAVLLDGLMAAPGLLFADSAALRIYLAVGVALSIAALVLLALPASRRAYV
ncbi:MAG TPA: hypothetical protein VFL91_01515 [Thermomicrobiales bacterium]|nr:hypothetical protein [Thermomicrobiales bacterium]